MLIPRATLMVESTLTPGGLVANIDREAAEWNRKAVLFGGMRCQVKDSERVRVGWLPWLAPWRVGVMFDGRVSNSGGQTVIAGEVRFSPRWCEAYFAVLLLAALAAPLLIEKDVWLGLLVAGWLAGGSRVLLGFMFRTFRNRIRRVLRAAAAEPARNPLSP